MKVRYARQVLADLEGIAEHLLAHGVDDPNRPIEKLIEACRSIADMPRRFQIVEALAHLGVRRRVAGHYLIYFREIEDTVLVLRIVHGAAGFEPAAEITDDNR